MRGGVRAAPHHPRPQALRGAQWRAREVGQGEDRADRRPPEPHADGLHAGLYLLHLWRSTSERNVLLVTQLVRGNRGIHLSNTNVP